MNELEQKRRQLFGGFESVAFEISPGDTENTLLCIERILELDEYEHDRLWGNYSDALKHSNLLMFADTNFLTDAEDSPPDFLDLDFFIVKDYMVPDTWVGTYNKINANEFCRKIKLKDL
jgi:hypothetical protein